MVWKQYNKRKGGKGRVWPRPKKNKKRHVQHETRHTTASKTTRRPPPDLFAAHTLYREASGAHKEKDVLD